MSGRMNAPGDRGLLGGIVASLAVALALVLTANAVPQDPQIASAFWIHALITGLTVLLLAIGSHLLAVAAPGERRWMQPPVLITLWLLVMFEFPGLLVLMQPDSPAARIVFGFVDIHYVPLGDALVLLGSICLWISYLLGVRIFRPSAALSRLAPRWPRLDITLVAFAISVFIAVAQIWLNGVGYGADASGLGRLAPLQQWLGYLADMGWLVLAIAALQTFRGEWPPQALITIVAVQLLFAATSGFMKPVLWLSLILVMSYLLLRGDLRRFALPMMGLALLGLLIVPVAENLRTEINAGRLNTRSPAGMLNAAGQATSTSWGEGLSAAWDLSSQRTLSRQAVVAFTPALITERTPSQIPFIGFQRFLAIPAYVIPRIFWPSKPILTLGNWFAIMYFNQPSWDLSSAAMTIFGEGYMIWGWGGTALACMMYGLTLALIYRLTASAGLWAIYLALTPIFIDIENQFSGLFVALVQRLLVFLAFYWIMVLLSEDRSAVQKANHSVKGA